MNAMLFDKKVANDPLKNVLARAGEIILGKDQQIRMAMCCILARGHLLIEDVPGVGKTTLSHVIASLLGLHYQRIQFTSDLLPADIVGVSIFDRESSTFQFHAGPVFSQVILADEINRASPKAQSALLEAMEEHQVTADGKTMKLPRSNASSRIWGWPHSRRRARRPGGWICLRRLEGQIRSGF